MISKLSEIIESCLNQMSESDTLAGYAMIIIAYAETLQKVLLSATILILSVLLAILVNPTLFILPFVITIAISELRSL